MDLIERVSPFGQGNAEARFVLPAHRVKFGKIVGDAHVRVLFSKAGTGRGSMASPFAPPASRWAMRSCLRAACRCTSLDICVATPGVGATASSCRSRTRPIRGGNPKAQKHWVFLAHPVAGGSQVLRLPKAPEADYRVAP